MANQNQLDEVVFESRHSADNRFAPGSGGSATGGESIGLDVEVAKEMAKIPDKMAFKIGEVADLLEVKPYVLRYWESEFEVLKPKKSKHNQRMYERKDIESLILIKKLLYRDRYSIEGAKQAFRKEKKQTQQVKQIKTMAEHLDSAKDIAYEILDGVQALRAVLKG